MLMFHSELTVRHSTKELLQHVHFFSEGTGDHFLRSAFLREQLLLGFLVRVRPIRSIAA